MESAVTIKAAELRVSAFLGDRLTRNQIALYFVTMVVAAANTVSVAKGITLFRSIMIEVIRFMGS